MVPGVSSSIAVPEHFGIPVTHRGLARSFTVVTGHTRDGQEEDWQALARLQGTLVFLMGLERLETICRRLILEGKAPDTPASILCGGYTLKEIRIDGTLADLTEKARAQGAFAPAIILVGPVAGLGLRPAREANPEKILVTGTPVFCGEVAGALASVGKMVTELPILELEPCSRISRKILTGMAGWSLPAERGPAVFPLVPVCPEGFPAAGTGAVCLHRPGYGGGTG